MGVQLRYLFCLWVVSLAALYPPTSRAAEYVMYQEVTDNRPEVGVSTTVYLGDRMLEQRHGQWKECIVPTFSEEKIASKFYGLKIIIKAGEPLCKSSPLSKDGYSPLNYNNQIYQNINYALPMKIKEDRGVYKLCIYSYCTDNHAKNDFKTGAYFSYASNQFQNTIEYAGRSGDILKFTYSEFTDGYARQAFTREFQVDLTQGNVAAYKGAVIEIVSATNSSITYKVVRNFQQ